jgi:hypothetical protein
MRKTVLGMLLLAFAVITWCDVAEGQGYSRQYYGNGSKINRWYYHRRQRVYSTYYYYRPHLRSPYRYHYVYYYPARPRYVYYYNPYKKVYWGRCPIHRPYNYELLAENDRYIGQGDDRRPRKLNEINEDAFRKGQLVGMPRIPESDEDDPTRMDPPPPPSESGEPGDEGPGLP